MITLAELARQYQPALIHDFGHLMRPEQQSVASETAAETAASPVFYGDLHLTL